MVTSPSGQSFVTNELDSKRRHLATKRSCLAANSPPRSICSIRECLNCFFEQSSNMVRVFFQALCNVPSTFSLLYVDHVMKVRYAKFLPYCTRCDFDTFTSRLLREQQELLFLY